jgi:signal transduction histidine kinase
MNNERAVMVLLTDISTSIENEHLRETARYKDAVLANVTHDLKTPLAGIIGVSRNLAQQDSLIAPQMDFIRKTGQYLLYLISDILDAQKLCENKLRIMPTEFDIQEVFDEVAEIATTLINSRQVQICQNNTLSKTTFYND